MAPTPTGTAFCMARPRVRSSRAVSLMLRLEAAASAEYSPSECPATNAASAATEKPASVSSTRRVASETAINAGWAFSVSCRVSAGPSQIMVVSRCPSAASTSSKTVRAARKASAKALPMPTAWEPCPGKVNAAVINTPEVSWKSLKLGRKTLQERVVSSHRRFPADSRDGPIGPLSLAFAPKIRINRAIRGSRPGAERTVSAISPFRRC
jgi:hypothetical protein